MTHSRSIPTRRSLAVWVTAALATPSVGASEIHSHPDARGKHRPSIHESGNGTPVVDITTPGADGVSHNVYRQLDVDKKGVVFNNGRTTSATALAGQIGANPALASGTADLILNEVRSATPSQLAGYLEIGGDPADLVVANPAGITCDGCGFINAERAMLTTGRPLFDGDRWTGLDVRGGRIRIEGEGMDASRTAEADLLARAVEINAGLWADRLEITTGTGRFDRSGTLTESLAANTPSPEWGIDTARLGGMYANKIRLVANEHGVGVRNAGTIAAGEAGLAVTVDGKLVNHGTATTAGNARLQADRITNTGEIHAQADLGLDVGGTLDNRAGRITGQADVTANAAALDNRDGTILAGEALTLTLATGLENEAGLVFGQDELQLATSTMSGDGQWLSDGDIGITIGSDHQQRGEVVAGKDLSLQVDGELTNHGRLAATGAADVEAMTIANLASAEMVAGTLTVTADDHLRNRGLIDGGEVDLAATTIDNTPGARIYGDLLSVTAHALRNLGDDASAATLAARDRLELGVDHTENRNGALILSAGDMQLAGRHEATADHLLNENASIEAFGDLSITAARIDNLNAGVVTTQVDEPPVQESWIQLRGSQRTFDAADCSNLYHENVWCQGYPHEISDFTWFQATAVTSHTELVESRPATLQAGGSMSLEGGTLRNVDSQIIAGDRLQADLDHLDNHATQGQDITRREGTARFTTVESCGFAGSDHCREWHGTSPYRPAPEYGTPYDLPTVTFTGQADPDPSAPTIPGIAEADPSTSPALPSASLFRLTADNPNAPLIETDPRFTAYRQWYGSEAMLEALARDPAHTQKRLGDGFYEQALVRQQVIEQTGQRRLDGFADDDAQFRALIDAGIAFGRDLDLAPGVRLTAEQLARLTTDIVWLESETVTTGGEPTRVLVPRLHLTDGAPRQAGTSGRIAATDLDLSVAGTAVNRGTLAASDALTLAADRIENLGGSITAASTRLAAAIDIYQRGGETRGDHTLSLSAGRDIIVEADTRHGETQAHANRFSRDQLVDRGRLAVAGDGELSVVAARDLTLQATDVTHDGNGATTLAAGRDLNLTTTTVGQDERIVWDSDNHLTQGKVREVGTTVDTQGDLDLFAGRDVAVRAGNINADDGAVTITAGRDIHVFDGEATRHWEEAHKIEDDGWASSTVAVSHGTANDRQSQPSRLTGDSVRLSSNQDIELQGSHINTFHGLSMLAGGNIRLLAGEERHEESHFNNKQRSGFTTNGYNRSQSIFSTEEQRTHHVGSSLRSRQGDVTLLAGLARNSPNDGGALVIDGSRVSADAGHVGLTAHHILLRPTQDNTHTKAARLKRNSTWAFATALPSGAKDSLETERRQLTTNHTTLSGRDGISLLTSGIIDITAARLESSNGDVGIKGGQVRIRSAHDHLSVIRNESHEKTGVSWEDLTGTFSPGQGVGYETTAEQVDTESTLAPSTINGRHVAIRSTQDDIDLAAVRIEAIGDATEGASVRIDSAGDLYLGTVTTETFHRRDETHKDLAWQGAKGEGRYIEQTHYNRVNAERVELSAGDRITADITSDELVKTLAETPGMDWLRSLRHTPSLTGQVDWQAIEEVHEHWSYDEQGLTPAAATVVAALVTYFTAGAGTSIVNAAAGTGAATTTTGTIAASIAEAAVTNLATEAAVSLINNEGDITKALNKIGDDETLRATVSSMLSAGINTGFGNSYGLERFAASAASGCAKGRLSNESCQKGAIESATMSGLQWISHTMRQNQLNSSKKFSGICDADNDCISNISGRSVGVDSDNVKLGGGRINVSSVCEAAPDLCNDELDSFNTRFISENGKVFIPNGLNMADGETPLTTENLLASLPQSPLGGLQGGSGVFGILNMGVDYESGSFLDILVESFAGPHDWLNSSHYYGDNGNIDTAPGIWGIAAWNSINVALAAPFGLATLCSQTPVACDRVRSEIERHER